MHRPSLFASLVVFSWVAPACTLPTMQLEPRFAQRAIDWPMPEVYGIWPPSETHIGPFTVSEIHLERRQGVDMGAVHQVGGFDLTMRVSAGTERVDDVSCRGSGTPRNGDELVCTFAGPLGARTMRNVTLVLDPRDPVVSPSRALYVVTTDDAADERLRVTRALAQGFQSSGSGYYVARGEEILGAIDLHVLGVPRAHADQELDAYTQHEVASVMAVLFVVEGLSFD